MPLYEYKCQKCGAAFEELVGFGQKDYSPTCAECGSKKTARQISSFAMGKGSGRSAGASCAATSSG